MENALGDPHLLKEGLIPYNESAADLRELLFTPPSSSRGAIGGRIAAALVGVGISNSVAANVNN